MNYYLVENRYRKISLPSVKEFKSFILLFVLTLSTMFISLNTNGYSFRHTDLESFSNEESTFQFKWNELFSTGWYQCLNRSKSDNL